MGPVRGRGWGPRLAYVQMPGVLPAIASWPDGERRSVPLNTPFVGTTAASQRYLYLSRCLRRQLEGPTAGLEALRT